jgi:hypothetical protein
MNRFRVVFPVAAVVVVATAVATPAFCQSYGLSQQTLAVDASAFRPFSSSVTFSIGLDGYLVSPAIVYAPFALPDGAEVVEVCIDAYSSDMFSRVFAQLEIHKLGDATQPPATIPLGSLADSNFVTGYSTACSSPFSYTIRSKEDVSGQGLANLSYRVSVSPQVSVSGVLGFGAVRILWRRQVSSAPGAPTFNDVPASDGAFQFIEALVASGVTAGCGGGNYCPDAPLTRRQMAVFLSKGLGLHWPD